jgi:hypothetical protein
VDGTIIEEVLLRESKLTVIPDLSRIASTIRLLDFSVNEIQFIHFESLHKLEELQGLRLSHNFLSTFQEASAISHLSPRFVVNIFKLFEFADYFMAATFSSTYFGQQPAEVRLCIELDVCE